MSSELAVSLSSTVESANAKESSTQRAEDDQVILSASCSKNSICQCIIFFDYGTKSLLRLLDKSSKLKVSLPKPLALIHPAFADPTSFY